VTAASGVDKVALLAHTKKEWELPKGVGGQIFKDGSIDIVSE